MPAEPVLPTFGSFEAIDTHSRALRPQLQGHQFSLCITRLKMELHMLGQNSLKAPPIPWLLFIPLPCPPCPWMSPQGYLYLLPDPAGAALTHWLHKKVPQQQETETSRAACPPLLPSESQQDSPAQPPKLSPVWLWAPFLHGWQPWSLQLLMPSCF